MPVNRKMMKKMVEEYGKEKGEDVYYATEMKRKKKHKGNLSKMLRSEK